MIIIKALYTNFESSNRAVGARSHGLNNLL
jgi:hypothetical protein